MQVFAHRGASGYAPENTLAAFAAAVRMGATHLETDVRTTRDGVCVLFHDERVDRTTDGHGRIEDLDWSCVRRLDAGRWFAERFAGERVPRLEDLLDRFAGRCGICLEIKTLAAADAAMGLLAAGGWGDDSEIEFSTFDWEIATRLRSRLGRIRGGLLVRAADVSIATLQRIAAAGLAMVGPPAGAVTSEFVESAHALHLRVRAWGVKSRQDLARVVSAGVDGTTLNWPDWHLPRAARAELAGGRSGRTYL